MSVLISVKGDTSEQWMPALEKSLPEENHFWNSFDHQDTSWDEVRYALVWGPDEALFKRLPNLEIIFSLGAGVDHILNAPGLPSDIPIVRYVGADLTAQMGEWVASQCLMHLRQQPAYSAFQRDHVWNPLPQPSAKDVRIGVMGLGEMGLYAAQLLQAIGFQVSGWSRSQKTIQGMTCYAGKEQMAEFLGGCDMVVSLLPNTPETKGLLNATLIDQLAKDGALGSPVLINGGRGASQVTADIVAALQDGRLKGASLDVFESEPLHRDHPAWDVPNLFITPHIAAWSDRAQVVHYTAEQIKAYRSGKPLRNLVDRSLGY